MAGLIYVTLILLTKPAEILTIYFSILSAKIFTIYFFYFFKDSEEIFFLLF